MRRLIKRIGSVLGGESQDEISKDLSQINKSLKIISHVEKNLGPIYSTVSFDMFDSFEPLTIIIVKPTTETDFYTLVTAGMSYRPMADPNAPSYAELVLCLPPTWQAPKDEDDIKNLKDKDRWPLLLLLKLAEFPHKHNTFLGLGHSVPLGGDYNGFSHAMLNYNFLSEDFAFIENKDDVIFFLGVYPITKAEFEFKKHHGSDALMDWLLGNNISFVFDLDQKRLISPD